MMILIHPRWWLTKLFSLLQPYGLSFMSLNGLSSCGRTGLFHTPGWGRRVPPVLPTAWVPFSGANAVSTLRPRPGLRHMYSLVNVKTFSTHVVFIFRPVVREKRFSTHGNLSYIRVETQPKRPRFHSKIIKGYLQIRMRRRRRRRLLCWCGRNHLDLPRREPQE